MKRSGDTELDLELFNKYYVNATTTTFTATSEDNGIKMQLSGSVEGGFQLNSNELYACKFSKGHKSNSFGTA